MSRPGPPGKYRSTNPELIAAHKRAYKARKNGAEGSHTSEDVKRILEQQAWCCVYCQADLHGGYHVDHRMPLSRGGTNWPDNIQATCERCNIGKKDRTHEEFLAYLANKR